MDAWEAYERAVGRGAPEVAGAVAPTRGARSRQFKLRTMLWLLLTTSLLAIIGGMTWAS